MRLLFGLLVACAAAGAIQAQPAAGSAPDEYRIGPEDILDIQVYGRGDLTSKASVDQAGRIHLPLVGAIEASGRSASELSETLTRRYQLLDPSLPEVLVSVSQYNSLSIAIAGEVHNPGRYGYRELPDLWQALLTAGGPTSDADLSRVQIVRKEPQQDQPAAQTVDISLGVGRTTGGRLPQLKAGDTILVPSLAASLSSGDRVLVLGSVQTPGAYRLSDFPTISGAIAASGGYLTDADLRKVSLTRLTETGPIAYELNMQGYLLRANPAADLRLRPGDVVTVPGRRSALATVFDNVGQLAPLLSVALALAYAL
ncbi:MAG: polysaccharide biosynthesis/export family protein [Candidatus Eisenbacteria bacterium]